MCVLLPVSITEAGSAGKRNRFGPWLLARVYTPTVVYRRDPESCNLKKVVYNWLLNSHRRNERMLCQQSSYCTNSAYLSRIL